MQNKFPEAKVYCVVVHACDCASVCEDTGLCVPIRCRIQFRSVLIICSPLFIFITTWQRLKVKANLCSFLPLFSLSFSLYPSPFHSPCFSLCICLLIFTE